MEYLTKYFIKYLSSALLDSGSTAFGTDLHLC